MAQMVKFKRACDKSQPYIEKTEKRISNIKKQRAELYNELVKLELSISNSQLVEVGEVVEVDKEFLAENGFCLSVRDRRGKMVYLKKDQIR